MSNAIWNFKRPSRNWVEMRERKRVAAVSNFSWNDCALCWCVKEKYLCEERISFHQNNGEWQNWPKYIFLYPFVCVCASSRYVWVPECAKQHCKYPIFVLKWTFTYKSRKRGMLKTFFRKSTYTLVIYTYCMFTYIVASVRRTHIVYRPTHTDEKPQTISIWCWYHI